WHCLEVGGGGGSVAAWLCDRVGDGGRVVATDIDTRFLDALNRPNPEGHRPDIAVDPLPERAVDLVPHRTGGEHPPGRREALGQMAAALKPGGWLVVEASDFATKVPDPGLGEAADLFARWAEASLRAIEPHGFDRACGRRLAGWLRDLGLTGL